MLQLATQRKLFSLRDYQERACNEVEAHFQSGAKGVFLVAPCRAGKTQMFTYLAKGWVARGAKVAIVAHRIELIYQAGKTVIREGLYYGVIKAGPSTNPQAPIQICSIDSLRCRGLPWEPDYLIIDEAHWARANRYQLLMARHPDAKLLLVSATPKREDGKGFEETCDAMVIAASIPGLLFHPDGPYLVKPIMYSGSDLKDIDDVVKTTAGDYNSGQLEDYMRSVRLIGDVVDEYTRLAKGRKGVIYAAGIAHSKDIASELNKSGIVAEHVDGTYSDIERSAILYRLKTGQTQIVCNVDILSEGWDEPTISYVGLARPTKSLARYLQQACRGLTISKGKEDCIIIDHGENIDREGFGHLLDERTWSLEGSGKVKTKKVAPRICKQCEAVLPSKANKCFNCGYERVYLMGIETVIKRTEEKKVEDPLIKEFRLLLRYAKKNNKTGGWAYLAMAKKHGKATVDAVITYAVSLRIQREEGLVHG